MSEGVSGRCSDEGWGMLQVVINQLVKKMLSIMMLVTTPLACALICQYHLDRQPWRPLHP